MRRLDLTVYEPGDTVGTISESGEVRLWAVTPAGELVPAGERIGQSLDGPGWGTSIDELKLSVRTYNLLKRENVQTAGDLLALWDTRGAEGLSDIRNFGQSSVDEVAAWVERLRPA